MKAVRKKGKSFKGFKPSPFKAEPLKKAFKKKAPDKPISRNGEPPEQPKPQPKEEKEKPMAEHPKLEKVKEVASRLAGKIRNLENAINAARATPPDPTLAAEFDSIQRDVDELKNPESSSVEVEEDDNGKKKKR